MTRTLGPRAPDLTRLVISEVPTAVLTMLARNSDWRVR